MALENFSSVNLPEIPPPCMMYIASILFHPDVIFIFPGTCNNADQRYKAHNNFTGNCIIKFPVSELTGEGKTFSQVIYI